MKTRITLTLLIISSLVFLSELKSQEVSISKPVFGVRLLANYNSIKTSSKNLSVLSLVPGVFIEYNEHLDLHFGIIYAHLFNPFWNSYTLYSPNAVGLAIGNRITSNELIKNMKIFNEWNVSITRVGYKTTNSHFQESELQSEALWVFNFSLGADYKLKEKLHISAGAGVGITNKQYGIFSEKIFLSPFLGIDYRFGIPKKN